MLLEGDDEDGLDALMPPNLDRTPSVLTIPTLPDPLALARLIEGTNAEALIGYAEILRRLFPETDPATLRVGGGVATFLGVGSPVSYAVGLGLKGKVTPDEIGQVVEFYRSRGAAPRVDVCPLADESLLAALRAHNFHLHEFINVLVRPVDAQEVFEPAPPEILIREARPEEAELWAGVIHECFSDGRPVTEVQHQFGLLLFRGDTNVPYLAEVDGQIVAAGALFTHGAYAFLNIAGVRAAYRRRGIHTALIRARLKKAQELGCTVAGLYTLPGNNPSQRNAERHGFKLAYTKVVMKADSE